MAQSELLASFIGEAAEVLGELGGGVARLRALGPGQPQLAAEHMAQLSILAHRLRGSSALYGYAQLSALASLMERLLDARPALSGEAHETFMTLLTRVTETLGAGVAALQAGGNDHTLGLDFARSGGAALLQGLVREVPQAFELRSPRFHHTAHAPEAEETGSAEAPQAGAAAASLGELLGQFVRENAEVWEYFAPEVHEHVASLREQLARGEEADLNVMFRAAHTIKGSAYMVGLPSLGDFAHRMEDLLGAAREGAISLNTDVTRVIEEATDTIGDFLGVGSGEERVSDFGARVEGVTSRLRAALTGEAPVPAALAPTGGAVDPAQGAGERAVIPAATATSIRVPAVRLEALLEQVGELVSARARITRLLTQLSELQLSMATSQERFGRTVRDFEERYLNPDMVQGETGAVQPSAQMGLDLSQQFAELEFDTYNDLNILSRSITELSADFSEVRRRLSDTVSELGEENDQLGKLVRRLRLDVNQTSRVAFSQATARLRRWARERQETFTLTVEGDDLLVESGILQRIGDPLMHLLTNAVYHGLSSREGRLQAGKSERGNVWIRASEQGNFLEIVVADDGQGLDFSRIRERALERGLRSAQELERMSGDELGRLVLLPGFSTAREVGQVAGRGVGLDVVATAIRQLGGELLISSERGVGTVFTLRVPTTQRIMDVLHIDLGGGHTAALPVGAIRTLRDLPLAELRRAPEGDWVAFEGQRVPVVDARPIWGVSAEEGLEGEMHLAFLSSIAGLMAVRVSDFGIIEEVTVTPPSALLAPLDYLSGMALSGTGRVLPILDPAGLGRLSHRPEAWLGAGEQGATLAVRRLLLVDDSLSVRRLVGKMLTRGGYEVVTANDGQEAFDLIQGGAEFDGVVTDLEMPRMNGYELISAVRAWPRTARLPMLVMTTRAGDKHQRLAFQLGADDYFSKPVNEALLLRRLGALLDAAERAAHLAPGAPDHPSAGARA